MKGMKRARRVNWTDSGRAELKEGDEEGEEGELE